MGDRRVLAVIAAGGVLGAACRYGLTRLIATPAGSFPWTILAINVTGSFALGVLVAAIAADDRPLLRPFLATGFLGAYTTYSTFAVETDVLVRDGHTPTAAAYAAASLVVGLAAAWAGTAVGSRG